jgi:two-component system chemotaxis response regulator CheY
MTQTKKLRVLVADDEAHCRALLRAVLTSMDCEVVGEAKNGEEAVALYKSLKPHMLLLDINMPSVTGDEVLAEIIADFPGALVIMLTSVADADNIEKCLDLGAANYIRKDTPLPEMKQLIKETWKAFVQGRAKPGF